MLNRLPFELKFLTTTTCILGGTYFVKKIGAWGKNVVQIEMTRKIDEEQNMLQLWSVSTFMGALYAYFALNVNYLLLHTGSVDYDTMIIGYSTVLFGICADIFHETRNYLKSIQN